MPTVRYYLAAATLNGELYAAGGTNSSGQWLTTVDAYDRRSKIWTARTAMPTGRFGLVAGVVNGLLYAVGGDNGTVKLNANESPQ